MQADWSVACGADDPWVVIPWVGVSRSDKNESIHYIDLREAPGRLNEIPEAVQYPCMAAALRRWNRQDAPVFTAKCDVWNYTADLFDAEDLQGFAYAQGSYIDLLPRDQKIFSDFVACEQMLRAWTARAQSIALPDGRCEWTLRPARIFRAGAAVHPSPDDEYTDGFATTLYVWGYGPSLQTAAAAWSAALMALIGPAILPEKSGL